MSKARLLGLAALVVVLVALATLTRLVPVGDQVGPVLAWVQGLGLLGLVLLTLAYTPAALLLVPTWMLTVALGYFYGLIQGFLAATLGATVAAAVVFLFGRTLGRGWIEARFGHHPRFRALDRAVGRDGFKIVLLTRLSPLLPYILLNYAFSLTRVSLRTFVLATVVGMMPVTLMWVELGTTLHGLSALLDGQARDQESDPWHYALLILGLVATAGLVVHVARLTRRALAEALTENASAPSPAAPSSAPLSGKVS
jgi:uncharacterized membrane protein YdjX (TVP38/TMEM64 family)